ncbi:MAG TPA: polysaccharide biosynthesis/export family protein [Xanthobacteraceae bacterium]|nr:polysaccharide biosynthesis/export family protein [Xanthobacteraceae bacterium]
MLAACAEAPLVAAVDVSSTRAGPYRLRPNDQVRVRVYNEPEVSGEYQVDSRGQLSIPLAGSVPAAGMTTSQVERAIAARLEKGIIRDPRVSVQVVNYGPFYIRGEVKRGGEYPYRPGMTALDAVAIAGGFTYRADEGKIYVRRAGATTEQAFPADAPVAIMPGDNVRIAERMF